MRIFKSHPLLKLVNSYVIDSPQPSNISYLWNFGSLLAFCLGIQIVTGVTLAMHYNPSVLEAFNSVEHIMRDVNNGWLIRYLHSNTASAFFFIVYLHIGRGLYYGSYKAPRTLVWTIGTVIFILMIATAFLGYKHSPKWSNSKHSNKNGKYLACKTSFKTTPRLFICEAFTPIHKKHYSSSANRSACRINNQKAFQTRLIEKSERLTFFLKDKGLDPVFSYEDLNKDEVRKTILLETKGLSGVYLILNKVTLDYYVGSASTNRLYARFSNHLLYFKGSKVVKHAVKKYKLPSFAFIVLELFPEILNKENNKGLIDREDFYLKFLLPNYNILTEAGNTFGYKHTSVDRLKMKNNYSIVRRNAIGNLNKGKKLSLETIEKMRQAALNKSKPVLSEKAKLNLKKRCKPIVIYNLDKTVYGCYSSIIDASNSVGCNEKTIKRALLTEKKILKRRYIVKYSNN